MIKARASDFCTICDQVEEQHTYALPEIFACPIVDARPEYIDWILEHTEKPSE